MTTISNAMLASMFVGWASGSSAAAPFATTQAPGFYRMMLGQFEVTALNDGVVRYETTKLLPTADPSQIKRALTAAALTDPVGMSYNAFLINTGQRLILIDTGTGGKLGDSPFFGGAGRLMSHLRSAGYQPEQVDEIYITHLGPDHVGGLTVGTERAFPNAVVRAARTEVEQFLIPGRAPKWAKSWVPFWASLFKPYIDAGKFATFNEDTVLAPGVRALATHGHSVGHTSYVVESGGETLVVLGDLVLMGALQFAQPSIVSSADSDQQAAVVQRERVLSLAEKGNYWVAGAHVAFPGLGHIRAAESGYIFVPANYELPN